MNLGTLAEGKATLLTSNITLERYPILHLNPVDYVRV